MKQKTYYKYADIINITGISERTFRYRIVELKQKYGDATDMLFKKGHSWRIHISLITEFKNRTYGNNN